MRALLSTIVLLALATPLITSTTAMASDEFPAGDDGFPEGDDGFPDGDDGGEAMPSGEEDLPGGDEEMPDGEADQSPPNLVAVPTAKPCSLKPKAQGYLQVMLDRARSLDLHGLSTDVELQEDRRGCVAEVDVSVDVSPRCSLTMRFEHDGDDQYELASLRLQAEECQELTGLHPGRYVLHEGRAILNLDGKTRGLCMADSVARIEGRLKVKSGRKIYELSLDGMQITGDLPLMQNDSVSCRKKRRSAPISLSTDQSRPKRRIWPWVVGGVSASAVAGGVTWYLLTREPAPGSLTLRLQ